MTRKMILRKIRRWLERHWTQCANARDKKGKPTQVWGEEATCHCLNGAILKYTGQEYHKPVTGYYAVLATLNKIIKRAHGSIEIVEFNDTHSHTEVLRVLDIAIAEEKS